MDGLVLGLFVVAAFAGGFVSGFSGFAMGLVVSGVWLHIITPIQTAALIAGYGLLTQGYGILKLRQALNWRAIWPLSLGTTIGIPIGVILLTYISPVYLRFGVGVLLVLYATYSLARPALVKPLHNMRSSSVRPVAPRSSFSPLSLIPLPCGMPGVIILMMPTFIIKKEFPLLLSGPITGKA